MLGWWALPAHAYLDPGTGSMLIQAVIGAIAAVGVTLRLYWHKIRLMFSSRTADQKSGDVGSAADADADPPIKEN